jgi:hypothetical protein
MPLTIFFGGPIGGERFEIATQPRSTVTVEYIKEHRDEVIWIISTYLRTAHTDRLSTYHLHDIQIARRKVDLKGDISLLQ